MRPMMPFQLVWVSSVQAWLLAYICSGMPLPLSTMMASWWEPGVSQRDSSNTWGVEMSVLLPAWWPSM